MDTCTNCGATLRPGAKFCTTCGTRLNETPQPTSTNDEGWGQPSTSYEDSGETSVLESVQQPKDADQDSSISQIRQQTEHAWSAAYGSSTGSTPSDDPASRFISALDKDVQEVETTESDEPSTQDATTSWDSTPPVFTPPPPSNWSYSLDTGPDAALETNEHSGWSPPSTWADVQATDEPDAVDSAGFTDGGIDEVEAPGGDEPVQDLPPDEARDHALKLADELRRTIRMIGSTGESDHGAAAMALTEVSLHFGDYNDVRGVLANVKNDPRDIEALGDLASKVDRIEELLDEHKSLVDAIETAIKELIG